MPSLLTVSVSTIEWDDGFTNGSYAYDNIYKGTATGIQGGQSLEDFNASNKPEKS